MEGGGVGEGGVEVALPVAAKAGVRDKHGREDTREDTKALAVARSCCEHARPLMLKRLHPPGFTPNLHSLLP